MGNAWLRLHQGDRITGMLPVTILDDLRGREEVAVEMPWAENGDPAGLLRRGDVAVVPVRDLFLDKDGLEQNVIVRPEVIFTAPATTASTPR